MYDVLRIEVAVAAADSSEDLHLRQDLIGGLGVYNMKAGGDVSGSDTKFGANAGAGFDLKLGSASLYAEGRFHAIQEQRDVGTGPADELGHLRAERRELLAQGLELGGEGLDLGRHLGCPVHLRLLPGGGVRAGRPDHARDR